MNKRSLNISVVTGLVAFVGLGIGTASAAKDCGGLGSGRTACDCGDTLTRSTKLRSSDGVVQNICLDDGLIIGANRITLDCRNKTITGDGVRAHPDDDAGVLLTERRKVTIKNCRITAFEDGIRLEGSEPTKGSSKNALLKNRIWENDDEGIELNDNSDHNVLWRNRAIDNGSRGIALGNDSDWNIVKANNASGNGLDGIEDCDDCNNNAYLYNIVDRNETEGLDIDGTNNLALGNKGRLNGRGGFGRSGLDVDGTGNKLKKNVFNRNGVNGRGDGICAVVGNTDGGGNRGRDNAGEDVAFDQDSCPTTAPTDE